MAELRCRLSIGGAMWARLIAAVSDWPALVQAVLGSALFWALLKLGAWASEFVGMKWGETSRARRISFLRDERLRYYYERAPDSATRAAISSVLLYRAARSVVQAGIFLALGLIFSPILYVVGGVAFWVAVYFLFVALRTLSGTKRGVDPDKKIREINAELARLEGGTADPKDMKQG